MSDIKLRLPNRHCALQLTSRTLHGVNAYEPHNYRHVIGPSEITAYKIGLWQTQISQLIVRAMHDGEMIVFSLRRYADATEVQAIAPALPATTLLPISGATTPCS